MKKISRKEIVMLLMTVLLFPALAQGGTRPPSQVVIESGLSKPYGQLGADFEDTRLGLGAGNGFELGFRYRLHLSETLSISPHFHFVDFGNFNGVEETVGEYRVECSSYRYGAEMMMMSAKVGNRPRPFLGLGLGLFRNRVKGFYQDFLNPVNDSVNTLGVSFRGGVQAWGFELSLVYNVNRFNTWQFYRSNFRERYNWDTFGVRVGWIIPFVAGGK